MLYIERVYWLVNLGFGMRIDVCLMCWYFGGLGFLFVCMNVLIIGFLLKRSGGVMGGGVGVYEVLGGLWFVMFWLC